MDCHDDSKMKVKNWLQACSGSLMKFPTYSGRCDCLGPTPVKKEIQTGKVAGIPVDESLARVRKIAGL
jgi:hypothetical protein